ncbi:uncharacterized protein LOC133314815 [Gastrolobium bilobum]|uniref:uncharacterized protein LOC133314815 n=1 Tax=Gastrolobium bilobum TaxID=150636 RepID=UPI002AAFB155|nr:uncharacterized protein LOC133314815 [Gastrolobium bilobum]
MEVKRRECERVTKEEEHKEDSTHIIVLTAGTFLLMVCLKYFLVEQWRAWVFLVLNVILLAILFMSMRPGYCDQNSKSENNVEEVKNEKKEKSKPCECSQEIECCKKQCWTSTNVHVQNEIEEDEEEEEEEEQVTLLSKEELNERVEAFIAMFRQHLISDVIQSENFRLNKTVNFRTKIEVPCY